MHIVFIYCVRLFKIYPIHLIRNMFMFNVFIYGMGVLVKNIQYIFNASPNLHTDKFYVYCIYLFSYEMNYFFVHNRPLGISSAKTQDYHYDNATGRSFQGADILCNSCKFLWQSIFKFEHVIICQEL